MPIELNGPKGLGDAIYLRAIALHLIERGEDVRVYTRWPDVFRGVPVQFGDLKSVDIVRDLRSATACLFCQVPAIKKMGHFQLACLQAGIVEPVELRMDWKVQNRELVDQIRRAGRPIVVFQPLRRARDAEQGLLRPDVAAFRLAVEGGDAFKVKLGHPQFCDDDGIKCDLDLFGRVSVTDALDVVSAADLVVSEVCYLMVAAQAMDKQHVTMFSRRALSSHINRVREFTPHRLFHKPGLGTAIVDDTKGNAWTH